MKDGVDHLASVVAAHLREWEPSPPFVELAVYGTDTAAIIAETLNSFCQQVLGAGSRRGLFHQSSVGSVTGILLGDGRSVVIKAHQPEKSRALLTEIVRIQTYLAENDIFAPRILAGPVALGHGLAIVEQFRDAGITADAHDPDVRRALAGGLSTIVAACDRFVPSTSLKSALLTSAGDPLWPRPHSKLFDFEATSHGAEWIDELAALAREHMVEARGNTFSPDESRLCGAAFAYACAYTARCGHALGADDRNVDGTFQHLVWSERAKLLDL